MSKQQYSKAVYRYLVGFTFALALSVAAYLLTVAWEMSIALLVTTLLLLAIVQLVVQLRVFLHLSTRESSYFKTNSLTFTISTLLIIVIGSLWIMKNLDYRMGMSPDAMQQYMLKQNKKGF